MKLPLPLMAACLAVAGCSTTKPVNEPEEPETSFRGPTLESRLDPKWYSSAKRISAKNVVIYYKGTADGQVDAAGDWSGTVTGDFLALWNRNQAIWSPKSTLTIDKNSMGWKDGNASVTTAHYEQWRHLLPKE